MEEELETQRVPLPKTPVLITAATKWEAEPLASALGLKRTTDCRWDGFYAGRSVTLLKTGVGAKKTADMLGELRPGDYGLVLSAGLCGAMNPAVKSGDLVADAREAELDLVKPLRETAIAMTAPFHFGKILHTNIVLQPASKKALGEEQRAVACDMETQAVRRWSGSTPAIGVRVVLDEMGEACPTETPDGEGFGAQVSFALTHASSLPLLIKTGLRASRGMKTLSNFIKAYLENI